MEANLSEAWRHRALSASLSPGGSDKKRERARVDKLLRHHSLFPFLCLPARTVEQAMLRVLALVALLGTALGRLGKYAQTLNPPPPPSGDEGPWYLKFFHRSQSSSGGQRKVPSEIGKAKTTNIQPRIHICNPPPVLIDETGYVPMRD